MGAAIKNFNIMSTSDLLSIENEWKEITVVGNSYFEAQNKIALLKYLRAFSIAEKLVTHSAACKKCNIPNIQIYLISCNNIAETYCQLKKWEQADKMYRRAIFYLLFINESAINQKDTEEISKSLFRQVLLYKEFTTKSNELFNYQIVFDAFENEGFSFKSE